MKAVTIYGGIHDPEHVWQLASAAGANTIRVTDFLPYEETAAQALTDETAWQELDRIIAGSSERNLRVLLDLSPYRNLLIHDGMNPYTQDWTGYLNKVATRSNTQNGIQYRNDPTIALVSIAGEPEPPNGKQNPTVPTSNQLDTFYATTLNHWHRIAPHTLVNTGGFIQLDWNSGVHWKRLFSLPGNDVCSLHIYGEQSLNIALNQVADYCEKHGKPWILEEYGLAQQAGDQQRHDWMLRVFHQAAGAHVDGIGVWNLGDELKPESYDINPATPLTWQALQEVFATIK